MNPLTEVKQKLFGTNYIGGNFTVTLMMTVIASFEVKKVRKIYIVD